MDCNKVERLRVGDNKIWQIEGQTAFFFHTGMSIDADGAPQAYHPDPGSDKGLDQLANAGHPGCWWGVVTDDGKSSGTPIIQGAGDPAPGFYVSMTSLQDKTKDPTSPLCYVDATRIPYVVLPLELRNHFDAQLGDMAVVINSTNRRSSGAIFADVGREGHIGEGSIALAANLGIPSDAKTGGADSGVICIIFPGSGNGKPRSMSDITTEADRLFLAMNGMAQLRACFPDLLP